MKKASDPPYLVGMLTCGSLRKSSHPRHGGHIGSVHRGIHGIVPYTSKADTVTPSPTKIDHTTDGRRHKIIFPRLNARTVSTVSILASTRAVPDRINATCPFVPKILSRRLSLAHGVASKPLPFSVISAYQAWKKCTQPVAKTITTTIRNCSGASAYSKQPVIGRSKSLTIPTSRDGFLQQSRRYEQHGTANVPPALVVSFPSEDEPVQGRCKGLVCPFFAASPKKYPGCFDRCTERGRDPIYSIQRHLRKHKGDVSEDVLNKAIESFGVRGKHTKMFDNRRLKQDQRLSVESKLRALYKPARNVLFGTSITEPIQQCRLHAGHVRRRRRSSNKLLEGIGEGGRISRTRKQTSRATSRTSSSAAVHEARCLLVDDFGASEARPQVTPQTTLQNRVENISKRMASLSGIAVESQAAVFGFHGLLDHFADQLDEWERQNAIYNHGEFDMQVVATVGQDPVRSSIPTTHDFQSSSLYPQMPRSFTHHQYSRSEGDIDLNTDDSFFQFPSDINSSVSQGQPHVPRETTWQQKHFGRQQWPDDPMQASSQRSHTPESFARLTRPDSPSMTSIETPAPQPFWQTDLPLIAHDQGNNPLVQGNLSTNTSFDFIPQGYHCGFCGQSTTICEGNHTTWMSFG